MNGKVKFGWRVPDFPVDTTRGIEFTRQITNVLDEVHMDFDSAWQADHFVPWAQFQDPTTDTLEAWSTIAYLAGRYENLMVGNFVLCQSYRSPALLAKMAATLQTFTEGRLILAIGAGWKKDEYESYGYQFPPLRNRMEQLEESVQILKLMWEEPRATFKGNHYHVLDAICEPKPVPLPPLMIGGGGRKVTLRITAQYADWWNFPGGTVEHYQDLLEVLNNHCKNLDRDYNTITKTWGSDCVAVAPTHEAAVNIARSSPFYEPETAVVGTPEEVASYLHKFVNLGVEHFILRFVDFPKPDGAKLFAQEVIPQLQ